VSSGGAGIASRYALGWGAAGQLAASIAAILVIAELGWGIVQRSLWQRLYHVALEVELFGEKAVTQALLDTGNRLKDPLGGAPVIIVEHGVVARLMPEHLRPALLEMEGGDLAGISRLLASERWSSRFRVIPYSSLGREKGLLVGFRPDAVTVVAEGRRVTLTGVVIGISPKPLDPEGSYSALLHPELLEAALREGGRRAAAWTLSTSPSEGETSHASTAS
ncbi:MAG: sigma-E processing peptidase SpoIIGA, partial [Clostridia bacterium]